MIKIEDKSDCCGCEACVQICPKQCISFCQDEEGFFYPKIDSESCINCGLCEKVCPVINQDDAREPLAIYAAKNKNKEIRKESSSGGVFTLLAENIIAQGGVVFGARWNENWEVVHDYIEAVEDIALFRGSKYVQSRIGDCYKKVQYFLKADRQVLFSGTPCQVAGLKKFLRNEYNNLLTVDIICHGVPSPAIWQTYLAELIESKGLGTVKNINFRDKTEGWSNYRFHINGSNCSYSEASTQNIYMRGFLKDLYLRPSCHSCPSKSLKSGSDITIADFWGISSKHPGFDNNSGANLIIINSPKGVEIYSKLDVCCIPSDEGAFQCNPSIYISSRKHAKRSVFFAKYAARDKSILPIIKKITKDPLLLRVKILLWKIKTFLFKRQMN